MWIAWLLMACGGGEELAVQILPESPVTSNDLFAAVSGDLRPGHYHCARKS